MERKTVRKHDPQPPSEEERVDHVMTMFLIEVAVGIVTEAEDEKTVVAVQE